MCIHILKFPFVVDSLLVTILDLEYGQAGN